MAVDTERGARHKRPAMPLSLRDIRSQIYGKPGVIKPVVRVDTWACGSWSRARGKIWNWPGPERGTGAEAKAGQTRDAEFRVDQCGEPKPYLFINSKMKEAIAAQHRKEAELVRSHMGGPQPVARYENTGNIVRRNTAPRIEHHWDDGHVEIHRIHDTGTELAGSRFEKVCNSGDVWEESNVSMRATMARMKVEAKEAERLAGIADRIERYKKMVEARETAEREAREEAERLAAMDAAARAAEEQRLADMAAAKQAAEDAQRHIEEERARKLKELEEERFAEAEGAEIAKDNRAASKQAAKDAYEARMKQIEDDKAAAELAKLEAKKNKGKKKHDKHHDKHGKKGKGGKHAKGHGVKHKNQNKENVVNKKHSK